MKTIEYTLILVGFILAVLIPTAITVYASPTATPRYSYWTQHVEDNAQLQSALKKVSREGCRLAQVVQLQQKAGWTSEVVIIAECLR